MRITRGAVYTSDFTPPTEPFKDPNPYGYKKDDLVVYEDNKIYRCITPNTDSTFDPAKWVEVSASDSLNYATNTDIDNLFS